MKFPSSEDDSRTPLRRVSAPAGASGAEGAPGLVTFQYKWNAEGLIEIDPFLTHLRRLRKAVLTAARMHEFELRGLGYRPAMLTLTYHEVDDWHPKHISDLLRRARMWLARRGVRLRYVWVAELQQRGALHYHALFWLPRDQTIPMPDKQGWWPHGSTRIEWARKSAGYLAKYASKLDSKVGVGFPPGARLYGRGGFEELGRSVSQWFNLPHWAREVCDLAGRAVRVKGVGLVERDSGVCLPSPWRLSRSPSGTLYTERIFCYADALRDVAGPFSWLPAAA
jgi:hypothetical protein